MGTEKTEDQLARANAIGLETAYPFQERDSSGMPRCGPEYGLTKRELFAAMAMQGICGDGIPGSHHRPEDTARDAVAYADWLLKELAK